MNPKLRRNEIVALVNRLKDRSVEDLSDRLGVSRETIRRDLAQLDAGGLLRKYHGGARALGVAPEADPVESPFDQRIGHNTDAKRQIAQTAARLFQPGDSLFIDSGSTTLAVADCLAAVSQLTVITNSPQIAARIGINRTNKVFLIGGAFNPDVGETLGPLAHDQIGQFRARHAILTVGGIDAGSIMDFDLQEAEVARAMIARADAVTVVADHSKFGRRAVFEVAPLSRISRVIADVAPPAALFAALTAAGTQIILP